MPLHTTDAIIIGNHDLGEADRIIVFYTKASGKVRAVAEGVRRIRSKFGGSAQLFTEGRLVYFERPTKTLHKVNEFAVLRAHQLLREDLDRIALASTAVEAVALGVEEAESAPDLYDLLANALDQLETAGRPALVLQGFLLHLLRHSWIPSGVLGMRALPRAACRPHRGAREPDPRGTRVRVLP